MGGYERRALGSEFRSWSFDHAREYARSLNLQSQIEWYAWIESGDRPEGVPHDPSSAYKLMGWLSWPDWLGYREGALPRNDFLPFDEAREYVRSLQLQSFKDWQAWSKSGKRPDNIPSAPDHTYRGKGWVSWPDWM